MPSPRRAKSLRRWTLLSGGVAEARALGVEGRLAVVAVTGGWDSASGPDPFDECNGCEAHERPLAHRVLPVSPSGERASGDGASSEMVFVRLAKPGERSAARMLGRFVEFGPSARLGWTKVVGRIVGSGSDSGDGEEAALERSWE